MKRVIALLLLFVIMFTASASYATEDTGAPETLSEMSQEECLAFIVSQGVAIPKELENYSQLGKFVKSVITEVEHNPACVFSLNYSITLDFANRIKDVVNAWYGNTVIQATPTQTRTNGLQYSAPIGTWNDVYYLYNCYAYALDAVNIPNGNYPTYPGYYDEENTFDIEGTIESWADATHRDLHYQGYQCVIETTSYVEAMELKNTHSIICLRRGTSPYGFPPDYHYMKYIGSNWCHKPGGSQPLRFLPTYPSEIDWINEGIQDGVYQFVTHIYTGTIYYFAFTSSHNYVYDGRTGNEYHAGSKHFFENQYTCACGETTYIWTFVACSGPPCLIAHSTPSDEEVMS